MKLVAITRRKGLNRQGREEYILPLIAGWFGSDLLFLQKIDAQLVQQGQSLFAKEGSSLIGDNRAEWLN